MSAKKQLAVDLAKRGFRVFPLAINGKTPAHPSDWQKLATTDPARIEQLWLGPFGDEVDFNIGAAIDADSMVFDEDVGDGKQGDKSRRMLETLYDDLPATFTVRTASGGTHRHLRAATPVANSASKVGTHIDIKAFGGFVVMPGSTIDGNTYTIDHDAPIADAPEWLTTLAGAPRPRATSDATPIGELDTQANVERATQWLTYRAPDAGTFSVAAKVKDFGVSQDKCLDLMLDHWPPAATKGEAHIGFRVENAYRYGQNAPGIASAEAEFEAVDIDQKPALKKRTLHFIPWADAKPDLATPFLIDDVMDLGAMVVTYGDSNTGKTYVVLDQCFHIATGKTWNGHKVRQGAVLYVAAEGGKGFQKRIEAFKRHHKTPDIPFALAPCPIDLQSDTADTKKLVALIRDVEAHYGQQVVAVVIDTLARAMGGGDENSSVDMGKFVRHADAIREATGATVNIVHHTGKDAARGARGHSSLRAATDTEIEVRPGVVTIQKQRDMHKIEPLGFELTTLEVGHRPDGRAVTACVVAWLTASEFEVRLTPAATEMLELFSQCLMARRDEVAESDDPAQPVFVRWTEWKMSCLSHFKGVGGRGVSETYLYNLRRELLTSGLVEQTKQKQWVTGKAHLPH